MSTLERGPLPGERKAAVLDGYDVLNELLRDFGDGTLMLHKFDGEQRYEPVEHREAWVHRLSQLRSTLPAKTL